MRDTPWSLERRIRRHVVSFVLQELFRRQFCDGKTARYCGGETCDYVWVHERPHTGRKETWRSSCRISGLVLVRRHQLVMTCWSGKGKKVLNMRCIKDALRETLQLTRNLHSGRWNICTIGQWNQQGNVPLSCKCRDHMKNDLDMKPLGPVNVKELKEMDMIRRQTACVLILHTFPTRARRNEVFFSDECAIYSCSRNQSTFFWT